LLGAFLAGELRERPGCGPEPPRQRRLGAGSAASSGAETEVGGRTFHRASEVGPATRGGGSIDDVVVDGDGEVQHVSYAALRALALLRIADGRPRQAVALLERGLRGTEDSPVAASQFLAPLVDARLALGDVAGAHSAAENLSALAAASHIRLLAARADLAAARVALSDGRGKDAAEAARRALAAFGTLVMPLEAGTARLALARAVAAAEPDTARDEARAALTSFRGLGASRAMDAAAAVLRELGESHGRGPRSVGELTARGRGARTGRPGDVERGDRPHAGDQ
jgi:hypothetical protein